MSIRYIVGNPGSGKTYLAVYKLHEYFISDKKANITYLNAYTNINQFNFNMSDKIFPLDFDLLLDNLSILHDMYLDKLSDDKLIQKAKELKIYNTLFVIDECHSNIFSQKNNQVLIWWLTYHRHLYHDIWLITQNLSLVDSKYKKIAEFFYKAIDGSNRFFLKKFKYALFNAPTMYLKKDIVPGGGISLKFDENIFNLYHSGASIHQKSYLKLYLAIIVILFLFALLLFIVFKNLFSNNNENLDLNISQVVRYVDSNITKDSFINETKNNQSFYPYNVNCFFNQCYIVENKLIIPEKFLHFILKTFNKNVIFSDYSKFIIGEYRYFLIFNIDIFKDFKNKIINENDDNERLGNEKGFNINPFVK